MKKFEKSAVCTASGYIMLPEKEAEVLKLSSLTSSVSVYADKKGLTVNIASDIGEKKESTLTFTDLPPKKWIHISLIAHRGRPNRPGTVSLSVLPAESKNIRLQVEREIKLQDMKPTQWDNITWGGDLELFGNTVLPFSNLLNLNHSLFEKNNPIGYKKKPTGRSKKD